MKTYTFLSYAHKDWPDIEVYYNDLIEKGHQIWHDKNIIPGDEWVESVADNLKNASGCLLFLSPDALESANVRREIHYAIANHIPVILVMLKPCELSEGLKMELSESRFIYPDQYASHELCIQEISGLLKKANHEAAEKRDPGKARSRKALQNLLFVFAGALLAFFCIGIVHSVQSGGQTDRTDADYLPDLTAFAKEYYEIVERGGEDNYRLLWDQYLSEKTKTNGTITEEKWIELNRNKVEEHGFHILEYEVISGETLPKDCFAFRSRTRFQADGEEFTKENREYLIIEDGKFRYLPDGILKIGSFEGGETDISGISITDIEVTEYANRMLFKMNILNKSGNTVFLGNEKDTHVITIDTTDGSYNGKIEKPFSIQNGQSMSIKTQFYLAAGRPESVTLNLLQIEGNKETLSASLTF